jgi:hypothetical protein
MAVQGVSQKPFPWQNAVVASTSTSTLSFGKVRADCFVTDLGEKRSWKSTGEPVDFIDNKDIFFDKSRPMRKAVVVNLSGPEVVDDSFIRLSTTHPGDGFLMAKAQKATYFQTLYDVFDERQPKVDVFFAFTTAPWKLIGYYDPKKGAKRGLTLKPRIEWAPDDGQKGSAYVTVHLHPPRSLATSELKVIAIHKDGIGTVFDPVFSDPAGTDCSQLIDSEKGYTNKQARNDIVRYRFETRAYTWVEFKGVRIQAPN